MLRNEGTTMASDAQLLGKADQFSLLLPWLMGWASSPGRDLQGAVAVPQECYTLKAFVGFELPSLPAIITR